MLSKVFQNKLSFKENSNPVNSAYQQTIEEESEDDGDINYEYNYQNLPSNNVFQDNRYNDTQYDDQDNFVNQQNKNYFHSQPHNINKTYRQNNISEKTPRFIEQSKFYGKENEDFEDWIFTIETNFMINKTPENLKISKLKDIALGEFKTLIKLACSEKKEITWEKFLASFRTRFRQLNYEANQFTKFMDIKQTENQSVKEFIHKDSHYIQFSN